MRVRTIPLALVGAAFVAVVAWAVLPSGDESSDAEEITVSCAASLVDVMTELGQAYERQQEGRVRVRFDFASSGMLRTKIEAGAGADAFVSASARHVDRLVDGGYVVPGTRRDLLRNTLVCVVKADSPLRPAAPGDLTGAALERIAIADPAHAPAGLYAAEALKSLGLWDALDGRLVYCTDVRAALMQVRAQAVQAAVVYRSDARAASDVRVVLELPAESHSDIVYPACVLAGSARPAAARAFVRFLASPRARKVFASHGFQPVGDDEGNPHVD